MDFFMDLGKKMTKVKDATMQKTKGVAEYAKINAKILDIQNKLDKAYIEVGKKYLEIHPTSDEEEMRVVVEIANIFEEQIKELRKQLHELKGTVKCEACGFECEAEATFCSNCGAEMKKGKNAAEAEFEDESVAEDDFEDTIE